MVFRQMPTVLSWMGGPASSASRRPSRSRIDAEQSSISLMMKEFAERIIRRVMRCAMARRPLRTISMVTGSARSVRGVGWEFIAAATKSEMARAGSLRLHVDAEVRVQMCMPTRRHEYSRTGILDDGGRGDGLARRQVGIAIYREGAHVVDVQYHLARAGGLRGRSVALPAADPRVGRNAPQRHDAHVDQLHRALFQAVPVYAVMQRMEARLRTGESVGQVLLGELDIQFIVLTLVAQVERVAEHAVGDAVAGQCRVGLLAQFLQLWTDF